MNLKPVLGGAMQRVDRPGSRFRIAVSFPPMVAETARIFVSRLLRAKSEGLQIPFPLPVPQGSPGTPIVDGAIPSGTTLPVRGGQANYRWREGYWLSIEDGSGQHYLHNIAAVGALDANGDGDIPIWPMLRAPFNDGAKVHLARPMIQGLPLGDETSWVMPVSRLFALAVTIEETE
ncbi:hypothetical protein ACIGGE_12035 [Qipengyuania sp. NPDC077410]|uniref:hypothetical protein n=1 Tax=Qipengyuania sp. NPDC077410 TaxID=3364496 RepID=UPI0037C88679